jgi:beta-phosphoglucomutase-like phosphatase (HAD superfamily)
MLELAGLATLVDERVDADVMQIAKLRARPATDLLDVSCRLLGVQPAAVVSFTRSPAGITAARAAGIEAVGVAEGDDAELLAQYGADRVVASLAALLDPRLRA